MHNHGLQCFNKIYDVTHYIVVNDIEIVFSQSFLYGFVRRRGDGWKKHSKTSTRVRI